jgi:hypothetical protein
MRKKEQVKISQYTRKYTTEGGYKTSLVLAHAHTHARVRAHTHTHTHTHKADHRLIELKKIKIRLSNYTHLILKKGDKNIHVVLGKLDIHV